MEDQKRLIVVLEAISNSQKGGSVKSSRENPIVDAIVDMAEAHARIMRTVAQFSGNSEAELNKDITAVVIQVLMSVFHNTAADVQSELETIYRESFWRTYHLDA